MFLPAGVSPSCSAKFLPLTKNTMHGMLRKAANVASRPTLTALSFFEALNIRHFSSIEAFIAPSNNAFGASTRALSRLTSKKAPELLNFGGRDFHAGSGHWDFRASPSAPQANFAVNDYVDEAKSQTDAHDGLDISKIGIAEEIVSSLAKKGITKLFPIQKAVLEPAMKGHDMIGRAKTGTGKTLAFGIPILDKILQYKSGAYNRRRMIPRALVLAPTRELAKQVDREFSDSAPSLSTLCVYGGAPIYRQISALDHGVDVVVGTPGRIIDLLNRGALNLSEVQFVVLDEADQMLNVGFEEDVEKILQNLPHQRQSLMFSATMPTWIRTISMKYLKNPLTIDLVGNSDEKLAEGITLYSIASDMYRKAAILGPLINEHAKGGKCIIFTQTKRDADRLAHGMARNFGCEALHGDISQDQRERTLYGFREGRFNILVATDVAARGLDVPCVDLIIHYELPTTTETFVHRSGRTGRAGKKGSVIAIYTEEQARSVRNIEREVNCRFIQLPRIAIEGGAVESYADFGRGGRQFGGLDGMRNSRYGESGGSSFGRSGWSRSDGYRSSRSGGFDGFPSARSSNFEGFRSGRSSGFGNFGSGRPDRSRDLQPSKSRRSRNYEDSYDDSDGDF